MFFLSEKDMSLSISGTSNNFLFMSLNSSKACTKIIIYTVIVLSIIVCSQINFLHLCKVILDNSRSS